MNDHDAPDTLTLIESLHEEVRSAGAEVEIAVSESSAFGRSSGHIGGLRAELEARGLDEAEVLLEGVEKIAWSWLPIAVLIPGVILVLLAHGAGAGLGAALALLALACVLYFMRGCTLRARYKLRCRDAAQVHAALDTVLSYRSAEVLGVSWRYDVDSATRAEWTERCLARASERARRVAASLGVRVVGVHAFDEAYDAPLAHTAARFEVDADAHAMKRRMSIGASLGAAPANVQRAALRVTVRFRVSAIQN